MLSWGWNHARSAFELVFWSLVQFLAVKRLNRSLSLLVVIVGLSSDLTVLSEQKLSASGLAAEATESMIGDALRGTV